MVSFNHVGKSFVGGQLTGGSEFIATLLRAALPVQVANAIAVVAFAPTGNVFVGKDQHLTIAKRHFGVRSPPSFPSSFCYSLAACTSQPLCALHCLHFRPTLTPTVLNLLDFLTLSFRSRSSTIPRSCSSTRIPTTCYMPKGKTTSFCPSWKARASASKLSLRHWVVPLSPSGTSPRPPSQKMGTLFLPAPAPGPCRPARPPPSPSLRSPALADEHEQVSSSGPISPPYIVTAPRAYIACTVY